MSLLWLSLLTHCGAVSQDALTCNCSLFSIPPEYFSLNQDVLSQEVALPQQPEVWRMKVVLSDAGLSCSEVIVLPNSYTGIKVCVRCGFFPSLFWRCLGYLEVESLSSPPPRWARAANCFLICSIDFLFFSCLVFLLWFSVLFLFFFAHLSAVSPLLLRLLSFTESNGESVYSSNILDLPAEPFVHWLA
jgi:hypothetical protein